MLPGAWSEATPPDQRLPGLHSVKRVPKFNRRSVPVAIGQGPPAGQPGLGLEQQIHWKVRSPR